MAYSGFQMFKSDSGAQIVVAFEYERGFEGVSIGNAWTRDEEHDFEITQTERDRFESWIMEHRSTQDQMNSATE